MDLPTDLSSPRRANKACCSCRRNKIKCDGDRPCVACLRRNVAHSCVDGCHPCRRSRSHCDGAWPCGRCREQGLDCLDEPVSPTQSTGQPSHRSVPSGRAKSACQACRRDNKKCDDSRPCVRCAMRGEECIHVERNSKAVRQRCVNCRKGNKKCEDNRPCRACVESNIDCVDAPRKGSARVRIACTNCRQAKVQCDAQRPCRTCMRRGLDCTISSCICAETSCEPETCTFCQLRRSNCSSQTADSDVQFENEGLHDDADAPPPPVTSQVSTWSGAFDLQGNPYTSIPSQVLGPILPSQYYPTNTVATSPQAPPDHQPIRRYEVCHHPRQQLVSSQAPSSAFHPAQKDFSVERTLASLDSTTDQGMDGLSMSTFAQLGGFPGESSSSSHSYTPTTSQPTSSMTTAGLTAAHATANSYTHSSVGVGVGVGVGTYVPRAVMSGSGYRSEYEVYGPIPMATPMPIAMTIPVQPQGGRVENADAQSVTGLHPLLHRSADYLCLTRGASDHSD